jgi:hypothetical protein
LLAGKAAHFVKPDQPEKRYGGIGIAYTDHSVEKFGHERLLPFKIGSSI